MAGGNYEQVGQQVFGNQQNADRIVNLYYVSAANGRAVVKMLSQEGPGLFKLNPIAPDIYRMKFSVERPGGPGEIHDVTCVFASFKVKAQVDGFQVFERPFSIAHPRGLKSYVSDRIQDVPIRFETYMKPMIGTRVVDVYIGSGDQPAQKIRGK